MTMNVYSFDKTLYNGNSFRDFYCFCLKRHIQLLKFVPARGCCFLRYLFGKDTKKTYTEKKYAFLREIPDIDAEVALFWETHQKKMKKWFPDWRTKNDILIEAHPAFFLEPIATKMNFTLIATNVDKHTGKITGEICSGEEKRNRFQEVFPNAEITRAFFSALADRPIADRAEMAYMVCGEKAMNWCDYREQYLTKETKKDIQAYERVCELETADFYRRFLPYSVGSPEPEATYRKAYTDQYQRVNLVCFADSHIDHFHKKKSVDNVRRIIQFANDAPIKYDAVVHAGDIITPFGLVEKKVARKKAKQFFDIAGKSKRPFIFAKGNHDANDWNNLPENVLTDQDWGELFLNHAEKTFIIHRQTKKNGEKSTWHYYDIADKKVRIVAVDIMDSEKTTITEKGTCKFHGGNSWYISNEQMNWIIQEAFNFDDKPQKDWGVVLTIHMYPKAPAFHANAADVLLDLCVAFHEQTTYSYHYRHEENSFFNMDIEADFTRYAQEEKKPTVICWLLGHDHERKNMVRKGINIIYIMSSQAGTICGDPRLARIPGTCTQNAFDVVNIDTLHRKIRVFAYGATTTCYGESGDRFLPDGLSY